MRGLSTSHFLLVRVTAKKYGCVQISIGAITSNALFLCGFAGSYDWR